MGDCVKCVCVCACDQHVAEETSPGIVLGTQFNDDTAIKKDWGGDYVVISIGDKQLQSLEGVCQKSKKKKKKQFQSIPFFFNDSGLKQR